MKRRMSMAVESRTPKGRPRKTWEVLHMLENDLGVLIDDKLCFSEYLAEKN